MRGEIAGLSLTGVLIATKHNFYLADIPGAGAQYTGVWYVLRLSILAPDGNTRLPMNVLPKNGSYRPITAGKGPSVPEGARRGMLLQMLSTLCCERRGLLSPMNASCTS